MSTLFRRYLLYSPKYKITDRQRKQKEFRNYLNYVISIVNSVFIYYLKKVIKWFTYNGQILDRRPKFRMRIQNDTGRYNLLKLC